MEIFIYLLIFIIGTLFGSFFSLAVYRIPIKQSIMHGRSYCPKCNHKLGCLDLIPILSYILLGGKCRYCKEKIRGRYIYLEIFSGIVFLLFAISLKINIYELQIEKLIYLIFGILFISTLFIIGGIDKENHNISNSVLLFGLIIEIIYIIYLYILNYSIYKYVIYLFMMLLLMLVNTIILKKKGKQNYTIQILTLCSYIPIFIKEELVIISIIITILLTIIKEIKIDVNKNEMLQQKNKDISIGFYLCVTNIVMLILRKLHFVRGNVMKNKILKQEKGLAGSDALFALLIIVLFSTLIATLSYNIYLSNTSVKRMSKATSYIVDLFEYIDKTKYDDITEEGLNKYFNNKYYYVDEGSTARIDAEVKAQERPDESINTPYKVEISIEKYNEQEGNTDKDDLVEEITMKVKYKLGNKDQKIEMKRTKIKENP